MACIANDSYFPPEEDTMPTKITKEFLQENPGVILHFNVGNCAQRTERWRSNGALKTWVTRPAEFRLPIKHGLYSYGEVTHENAKYFHLESECDA